MKIADRNDFGPEMEVENIKIQLAENYPKRNKFLKINATDKDDPEKFGRVEFAIDSDIFGIDNATGEIFLMQNLDYETRKSHQVL